MDNGVQSSTLKSYFSAIKHVLEDWMAINWDDNKVLLSTLVRGCKLVNDIESKLGLPIQERVT